MKEIVVPYSDDLAAAVHLTEQEMASEVRLMAALKMFELGKLSAGRAAELAGLSKTEFIEACGRYHVPLYNYSPAELDSELASDYAAARTTGE